MTQEDKYLLLQDLCARLPYGVKVSYYDLDEEILKCDTLEGVERSFVTVDGFQWEITDIKPYLFPLSSMTSKQKAELSMLVVGVEDIFKSFLIEVEFYHKHHIDYRGLIPMGLAIDATGLNIY
jgi:hypothetical protein